MHKCNDYNRCSYIDEYYMTPIVLFSKPKIEFYVSMVDMAYREESILWKIF